MGEDLWVVSESSSRHISRRDTRLVPMLQRLDTSQVLRSRSVC